MICFLPVSSSWQQQKAITIPAFSTEVNTIKNDFGVLKDRPEAWSCPRWRTDEMPHQPHYPTDERRSRRSELSRWHSPICRDGHNGSSFNESFLFSLFWITNPFGNFFVSPSSPLVVVFRASAVNDRQLDIRVHACSSSTLWRTIQMSSMNPHVSSGWRFVPDTLVFPVVRYVCRTWCCDVVDSVTMSLTCSGDEECELINFETCILYILKNFVYIMKNFPYLLKKTITSEVWVRMKTSITAIDEKPMWNVFDSGHCTK